MSTIKIAASFGTKLGVVKSKNAGTYFVFKLKSSNYLELINST